MIWRNPSKKPEQFYESVFQMGSFGKMGARILPALSGPSAKPSSVAPLDRDRFVTL